MGFSNEYNFTNDVELHYIKENEYSFGIVFDLALSHTQITEGDRQRNFPLQSQWNRNEFKFFEE